MWLTLLKGLAFKGLYLLKSPVTWIVLLSLATVFCARGWRGARQDVEAAEIACQTAAEVARAQAAEEANAAWLAVFKAHQEAVVRLSLSEAEQAAAARYWRDRYAKEKTTNPACAKWASEQVLCAVD